MLDYLVINIFSYVSVFGASKIFFRKENKYFESILIFTILSAISLIFKIPSLILSIKILLCILLIVRIFEKKISLNSIDKLFFLIFLFLLYFNFNDYFYKQDIVNGYGHLIKSTFYLNNLPHFDFSSNYKNFVLSLLSTFYYFFYIAGLNIFREDVVILSHNLFLIFSFFSILNSKLIRESKYTVLLLMAVFYLLINIFFQSGKNLFAEEISIMLIFFVSYKIFTSENKNDKLYYIKIACIFSLFGFAKLSTKFLIFFPVCLLLVNSKSFKEYIFVLLCCLTFFAFHNFQYNFSKTSNLIYHNQQKLIDNEEYKRLLNSTIFNRQNTKRDNDIKYFYGNIGLGQQQPQRIMLRLSFIKNEPEEAMLFLNTMIKKLFFTEVYKASILPPIRFLQNKILETKSYQLPRISINLTIWIILLSIVYFITIRNAKNKLKKIKLNLIFLFLTITLILNILFTVEDQFRHREYIDFANKIYGLKNEFPKRDFSRYLGWSVFFIIIFTISVYKEKLNNYFVKFVKILFIFLLIIAPARSYGHLFKIHNAHGKYVEGNFLKNKKLKLQENCKSKFPVLIIDDSQIYDSLRFSYLTYKFIFINVVHVKIEKKKNKDDTNIKNFIKQILNEKKVKCIILNNNSQLSQILIQKNFESSPIYLYNEQKALYKYFKINY